MKIIEILSEFIDEEIDGAGEYEKLAIEYKKDMPDLANAFNTMSHEEMGHVNLLHNCVTRIIENYRKENGDPPEAMLAVYDYLHKKQIDKAAKVKTMQRMYTDE